MIIFAGKIKTFFQYINSFFVGYKLHYQKKSIMKHIEKTILFPAQFAAMGLKIKEAREAKGLTQTELCKGAIISRQNLCDIEHGKSNFNMTTVILISRYLGVDALVMLECKEMQYPIPPPPKPKSTVSNS